MGTGDDAVVSRAADYRHRVRTHRNTAADAIRIIPTVRVFITTFLSYTRCGGRGGGVMDRVWCVPTRFWAYPYHTGIFLIVTRVQHHDINYY